MIMHTCIMCVEHEGRLEMVTDVRRIILYFIGHMGLVNMKRVHKTLTDV